MRSDREHHVRHNMRIGSNEHFKKGLGNSVADAIWMGCEIYIHSFKKCLYLNLHTHSDDMPSKVYNF